MLWSTATSSTFVLRNARASKGLLLVIVHQYRRLKAYLHNAEAHKANDERSGQKAPSKRYDTRPNNSDPSKPR